MALLLTERPRFFYFLPFSLPLCLLGRGCESWTGGKGEEAGQPALALQSLWLHEGSRAHRVKSGNFQEKNLLKPTSLQTLRFQLLQKTTTYDETLFKQLPQRF